MYSGPVLRAADLGFKKITRGNAKFDFRSNLTIASSWRVRGYP